MSFALYLLLTRWLSQRENSAHMQFYAGVSGCLVMSVALLVGQSWHIGVLDPVTPTLAQWGLLAALGAIATIGHWLVVIAFTTAVSGDTWRHGARMVLFRRLSGLRRVARHCHHHRFRPVRCPSRTGPEQQAADLDRGLMPAQ